MDDVVFSSHNSNGVWLWGRTVRNDVTGAKSFILDCLVTGLTNGSVLFCSLASVVCRRRRRL